MAIELLNNRNVEDGLHVLFVYVNDITGGLFIKFFLVSVWVIVCLGIYFGQKNVLGRGDFSQGVAIAGFVTVILATLLLMVPGLMTTLTFGVVVAVAVIGVMFFLSTKND